MKHYSTEQLGVLFTMRMWTSSLILVVALCGTASANSLVAPRELTIWNAYFFKYDRSHPDGIHMYYIHTISNYDSKSRRWNTNIQTRQPYTKFQSPHSIPTSIHDIQSRHLYTTFNHDIYTRHSITTSIHDI